MASPKDKPGSHDSEGAEAPLRAFERYGDPGEWSLARRVELTGALFVRGLPTWLLLSSGLASLLTLLLHDVPRGIPSMRADLALAGASLAIVASGLGIAWVGYGLLGGRAEDEKPHGWLERVPALAQLAVVLAALSGCLVSTGGGLDAAFRTSRVALWAPPVSLELLLLLALVRAGSFAGFEVLLGRAGPLEALGLSWRRFGLGGFLSMVVLYFFSIVGAMVAGLTALLLLDQTCLRAALRSGEWELARLFVTTGAAHLVLTASTLFWLIRYVVRAARDTPPARGGSRGGSIALLLVLAAAAPSAQACRGPHPPLMVCHQVQRKIAGAIEMYELDHATRVEALDPDFLRKAVELGYLDRLPRDPSYGDESVAHYRLASASGNGVTCLRHGPIQVVGHGEGRNPREVLERSGVTDPTLLAQVPTRPTNGPYGTSGPSPLPAGLRRSLRASLRRFVFLAVPFLGPLVTLLESWGL